MTMKKGSHHHWAYKGHWHEKKIAPGKWNISFKATKCQKPRRGVPKGSRYKWRINAVQSAVKTKMGQYQTKMVGTKKLVKARVKKSKKRQ